MQKIYFLIFSCIWLNMTTGQSWQWISPYPQSNNHHSVKFSDQQTVFASGEFGTILKSNDQGQSWNVIRSGGNSTFLNMYFSSPMVGFVTGKPAVIMKTTDGGTSWNEVYQKNDGKIQQIIMTGGETGYAAGQALILKTNDGGNTWNEIYGTHNWNSLFFITENKGFVAGENGRILKTIDGGATWDLLATGTTTNINSIYFVNETTGYAAGDHGLLLRTADSGNSWTTLFVPTQTDLLSLCFGDETTGYGVGKDGLVIMTDDGFNWRINELYTYMPVHSIDCAPGLKYVSIVVGDGGNILRTIYQWSVFDRINEWDKHFRNNSVAFADENKGFIAGEEFLRTDDGGKTWHSISASWDPGNDIIFIDSLVGFLVKSGGKYSKTVDGGNSWQDFQIPWCTNNVTNVEYVNSSILYMAAYDLYRTGDLGLTWDKVITGIPPSFPKYVLSTSFPDAKNGFAVGAGIWKSIDFGNNWTDISPFSMGVFYDVLFLDSLHGVICGYNGKILFTNDGGSTFTEADSPVSDDLKSLSYDQGTWYIAGDQGVVLKSLNGTDWTIDTPLTSKNLTKIYFTRDHKGFITGENATLLRKATEAASVNEHQVTGTLRVYPNPAKDNIYLELNDLIHPLIEIIDMKGKVLISTKLNTKEKLYYHALTGFPAGLYLVKVNCEGKTFTGKFLKM